METRICCKCRKEKDLRKFKIKIYGKRATGCIECNDTAKIYAERGKCPHGKRKSKCRECGGASICSHRREKSKCRECGALRFARRKAKNTCKICNDVIKITIKNWIQCSRQSDKKYNRFDPDHFIDTDFLRGLVEDFEFCYYSDCKVKLQYTEYRSDLGTIERLNNFVGHVKSYCVLSCKNCNYKRNSDRIVEQEEES